MKSPYDFQVNVLLNLKRLAGEPDPQAAVVWRLLCDLPRPLRDPVAEMLTTDGLARLLEYGRETGRTDSSMYDLLDVERIVREMKTL